MPFSKEGGNLIKRTENETEMRKEINPVNTIAAGSGDTVSLRTYILNFLGRIGGRVHNIVSFDIKNIFLNNKIQNLFKNTSIKKKWVRKQDNISSDKEASSKEYMTNIQTTDFPKKDIINDEKL